MLRTCFNNLFQSRLWNKILKKNFLFPGKRQIDFVFMQGFLKNCLISLFSRVFIARYLLVSKQRSDVITCGLTNILITLQYVLITLRVQQIFLTFTFGNYFLGPKMLSPILQDWNSHVNIGKYFLNYLKYFDIT